jgi:anti-sigma regulatory factor (Ser/Thr protein kinase)
MSTEPDSTAGQVPSTPLAAPRHEAVAYSSPAELAGWLANPVSAAVRAGDVVWAVLEEETRGRLEEGLGGTAAGVRFADPGQVHAVPGFTTAVRWARYSAHGQRTLIVGQQLLDLPGCGPEYWARLCLGLEVAAAGLPLTVLCPFRDQTEDWARIRPTHPLLGGRNGSGPNPDHRPARELASGHPPPPRPRLGPPAAELAFRAADLGELRRLTAELAARGGLEPDRVADAVLAVNELVSNSVEHGLGSGRLRLWVPDGHGLLAEVSDGGRLTEPFPGMVRPPVSGPRGRGLWLVSELCDVMEVWTDDGTVVQVSWRA